MVVEVTLLWEYHIYFYVIDCLTRILLGKLRKEKQKKRKEAKTNIPLSTTPSPSNQGCLGSGGVLLSHCIAPQIQRCVRTYIPQCQSRACLFACRRKGWDWGCFDLGPCQYASCGSAVPPSGQRSPGRKLVPRVLVVSQDPSELPLPEPTEHPSADPG